VLFENSRPKFGVSPSPESRNRGLNNHPACIHATAAVVKSFDTEHGITIFVTETCLPARLWTCFTPDPRQPLWTF